MPALQLQQVQQLKGKQILGSHFDRVGYSKSSILPIFHEFLDECQYEFILKLAWIK